MFTWLIIWLVTHWPIWLKKTSFLYTFSHSAITLKMNLSLQFMDWRFLSFLSQCNVPTKQYIIRHFAYLFCLQHGERVEFLCRCSFLEIYNEQIFDLLDPASIGLSLREDLKKGVFVDGLLERDVASARDAYRVGCKSQRKCSENKGDVKYPMARIRLCDFWLLLSIWPT